MSITTRLYEHTEMWGKQKEGQKVLIHGLHWHVNRSACFVLVKKGWISAHVLEEKTLENSFVRVFVSDRTFIRWGGWGIKLEISSILTIKHFCENKGLFSRFQFWSESEFWTALLKFPHFIQLKLWSCGWKHLQSFILKNVLIEDLFSSVVLSSSQISELVVHGM